LFLRGKVWTLLFMPSSESYQHSKLYVPWHGTNKATQSWPLSWSIERSEYRGYDRRLEDCLLSFLSRLYPPNTHTIQPSLYLLWNGKWLGVPQKCPAPSQAVSVFWRWTLYITDCATQPQPLISLL
jgi:hypothetical protein